MISFPYDRASTSEIIQINMYKEKLTVTKTLHPLYMAVRISNEFPCLCTLMYVACIWIRIGESHFTVWSLWWRLGHIIHNLGNDIVIRDVVAVPV